MAYKLTDTKTFYGFLEDLIFNFQEAKKAGSILGKSFEEKIILAVTQVNGCRLCNYVHSKNALKNGIKQEEIDMLLSGDFGNLSKEEAEAIFFAQHYAEKRAKYDKELYITMEKHIGNKQAKAVLGSIRKIMAANTHGIALDLLKMRFSGKKDIQSSFFDELGISFGVLVMIPILFLIKMFK